jgi:hypothetical protein
MCPEYAILKKINIQEKYQHMESRKRHLWLFKLLHPQVVGDNLILSNELLLSCN